MKISIVESSPTHLIKFYLFIDKFGLAVTSFYQAVKKPNVSLGSYNTIDEAREAIKNSPASTLSILLQKGELDEFV